MGMMIDGAWVLDDSASIGQKGEFKRAAMVFRNWITADGSAGPGGKAGYKAESGRYHLYLADACPWAHRTRLFRALKGLEDHISFDVVHPDMMEDGWTFATDFDGTTGDSLFGSALLREIYTRADPKFTGRVTVPILWDKQTGSIVSNESAEIIRMLNSAFDGITGDTQDFWPEAQRDEIEAVNTRIYDTLNNGVYKSGFARTQTAYEEAVRTLFDTLDWLEARLSQQRYLMGDAITEADLRLVPTLFRFDAVYVHHFKCNLRRLIDYPNLWAYAREFYQMNGVAETINFPSIRRHYFNSHRSINPFGVIPIGPDIDWNLPHGRT